MCPFTVRVPQRCCLADFLGSLLTGSVTLDRSPQCTVRLQLLGWICLPQSTPKPFNLLFRQQAALSLPRHRNRPYDLYGNINPLAIGCAVRLNLRTRLTLIRLALIRKPWSFGEGVSRPLYRYL